MSKTFGEGIFSAFRQDGILHIVATGLKPTPQTVVTIDELPFLIYPPQFALYFETTGITNPLMTPFHVERAFPNYPHKNFVSIYDKNGVHTIDVVDRPASPAPLKMADVTTANFVVYRQIGTDRYLIAKSDAIVLAIFQRVFGPDTLEHCQAFVADQQAAIAPPLSIVPNSLHAWINRQPGTEHGSRLIVTVDAFVGVGWTVSLAAAVPQGINPLVKLLRFEVQRPPGSEQSHAMVRRNFRYEEAPAQLDYTNVTVENGAGTASVPVENVS